MKPKILFHAKDAPTISSGYGIISRYLLPHLRDRYGAENILIHAPIFQREHIAEWQGIKVLPGVEFTNSERSILDHYEHHRCNLLLMVGDVWPLGLVPDLAAQDRLLWCQWLPYDWLGAPQNVLIRLKPAHKIVPFSKYGENALRQAGLTNVEPAIWLGLNLDLWKPGVINPRFMELCGYSPDTFNILIIGANQERKEIRSALEAIAAFRRLSPQAQPRLYLHTNMVGERDFHADLNELGLVDIAVYPEDYLMSIGGCEEWELVEVFRCADVVVNCAMEGFGFANTQAQAVGVPVICLAEGAGPELVQFGVEIPAASVATARNQMAQPLPNVMAMARALCELWQKRVEAGAPLRSQAAVQWVQENLGWDRIAEQWFGVIDRCMEDRMRYCLQVPETAPWLAERAATLVELP